uniref:Uncharacterized protein n=1 Tax=Oryza sativa subsp. japonica TaxID=39947 RepID=Q8LII9_ORYSJ|nr:hypothetical protein [Oryza sativa Japonica Group]BAD31107.1 hypothetical protein [Oryza sativa Japonica Group]
MELYAVVMTTTTEPSCIFLGGPRSPRRADGDTVMLKKDGNKRMGTNRSNASSTGSGVLLARYDALQSDMCMVTRDARKARSANHDGGRVLDGCAVRTSKRRGRTTTSMKLVVHGQWLISSVVRSAIREEALAFMAERCSA